MNRLLFLLLIAGLASCKKSETATNKFSDPVLLKIADLQDRRSSDSLYTYFAHENALYRKEAVLAFASIQDSAAVEKIGALLQADQDTTVRKASAFAMGQIRSQKSISQLEDAASKEKDGNVLKEIFEAYGKVAKKWNASIADPSNTASHEGLAWSLYRAGLNNAVDPSQNALAAKLLSKNENENTRLGAAHFFARGGNAFEKFLPDLSEAATADPSVYVRMAAAGALRKIPNDSCLAVLDQILKSEEDYRVRANAVRALQAFPFEKSKDYLFKALADKNINVGISAAEVIKATATENFWIDIANRASDIKNWRMQANLYEAVLKVKENKSIIEEIKTTYQRSTNPYQKAALLTSLQQSLNTIDFIEQELIKADTPVIRSSAASALVAINYNKKFQPALKKRFIEIYTKALQTGDAAVIGTVAGALGDSTLGYKSVIKDPAILLDAKKKLSLPKDNEALQPLEAAIAYFEGRKASTAVKNEFNHPIDWALTKSISKDQLAIIKTTKGNITIRLLVEEAPGSVANFVNLARQNYFDQKFFHREVPNFVIQAGCNRGDGWGSEDYSIRSEFSPTRYKTGSVGMASAGKDTEGTQWFITHSPTPHLDGRYTIFAEVQEGIEAVHRMEVGDQILDVEIKEVAVPN
jgi:cyclophilin family peptidyl-prolyl cis-trans isomerase/HEAT repeat protein